MPVRRRPKLARVSAGRGPARSTPRTRVVRLRMPSRRNAVAATVDHVIEAVRDVGLPAGRLQDLAVAVSEALSNAAVHGNRQHHDSDVLIRVEVTPQARAVVDVKDAGEGFDVAALVDPTEPRHLLAPAGRGVYLMRRLVDEVRYNGKGNRVRLTMERRKPRRRRA